MPSDWLFVFYDAVEGNILFSQATKKANKNRQAKHIFERTERNVKVTHNVAVQSQTAAGHGGSLLECQHWKSEAGGSPGVLGQPYLPSEFQAIQDYRVRPCLKNKAK